MSATLRGMTWSHPRGYDPMIAATREWTARTGHRIEWDKRSLQDFESFPVADLAARYDLIVIDHPHVGQVTRENCLLPLDVAGRETDRAALENGSVGASYRSYFYHGRQWAFPIDAATQVQAWRPDLLPGPVRTFDAALDLGRAGAMMLPLRPPHSLMSFFTLAAQLGSPCATDRPPLVDRPAGLAALERLQALASAVDPVCFNFDPIAVFEAMAASGSRIAVAPLAYGYVSYAFDGFRPHRLAFADMPVEPGRAPVGSALGGTGIAVSALSGHRDAAVDFAYFVASAEVQRNAYASGGGQPGHAAAWEDDAVNAATHDFYRATRATLEGAWVRPRHDGYMAFQNEAAEIITEALKARTDLTATLAAIEAAFVLSFG